MSKNHSHKWYDDEEDYDNYRDGKRRNRHDSIKEARKKKGAQRENFFNNTDYEDDE